MKLLVVLINYRTPDMTLRALRCVLDDFDRIDGACRVALVDNDSRDDSFDRLSAAIREKAWGGLVDLIQTDHNGGFSYGVNAGVRPALASDDPPEYIYLLNSDAFPDPGAVACLVDFLDTHPRVGIAGSGIYGSDGAVHHTAFQFHSMAGELESTLGIGLVSRLLDRWKVSKLVPTQATRVDWLAGASMLIRSQVFRDVGLFDEHFFLYYEETDFCRRAIRADWPTWYVPESQIEHVGSASTGWQELDRPRKPYWYHSRRRYFAKHHGALYLFVTNLVYLVGTTLGLIKSTLLRRSYPRPPRFYRDFFYYNFIRPPEHPCPPASGDESTLANPAEGHP